MHVNLIRPCVGIEHPKMLYEHQQTYRHYLGQDNQRYTFFTTRNTPRRKDEILNGGSVYWITKGKILMRQRIIDIETLQDEEGKNYCRISTDPDIMLTVPMLHRAMQGWRYFPPEKAPQDLRPFDPEEVEPEDIDPQLSEELRAAGLI